MTLAIECGFPRARRGGPMQAADGEALADVDGIPQMHPEAKRYRKTPVSRLLERLLETERPGSTSVLFWRDDGGQWRAALDACEILNRHRELLDLRAEVLRLRRLVPGPTTAEGDVWDGPEPLPAGKDLEAGGA